MEETTLKKVMPHSAEAEQSVIGAMLLDNESIGNVEMLLTGDDFYQKQYGIIFDAMVELFREGKPVDLLTLKERLEAKGAPPEISNMTYIGELIANVPITDNAKYYAEIVKEKSTLRQLIRVSDEIASSCYQGTEKVENIMAETESKIFKVLNQRRTSDFVPISQIVMDALDRIQKVSQAKGGITGIPTGFKDIDDMLSGLQPSDLIILAARPSMGKTAFALNIADYVAVEKDIPVAIFSLEMSKQQLVTRLFAMEGRINAQNIRNGELSDAEFFDLSNVAGKIGKTKLIIDDTTAISLNELRTKCRKYKLEHDIGLVVIDYLQLMSGNGKSEGRTQEVSEISRGLKAIARELDVPVIALSQLNRGAEGRSDHRPILSDLRESGAIEQDADVIMFIHRDDYYNKDGTATNEAEIIIAKQRNGPVGSKNLAWLPAYTKFVNLETRSNNENG